VSLRITVATGNRRSKANCVKELALSNANSSVSPVNGTVDDCSCICLNVVRRASRSRARTGGSACGTRRPKTKKKSEKLPAHLRREIVEGPTSPKKIASVHVGQEENADHRNRHQASDGILIQQSCFVWRLRRLETWAAGKCKEKNRPGSRWSKTWRSDHTRPR